MTTTIRGTDNSAAAPALTGNDSDTGIYFPAANKLGLVTGGTERVIVDDSGNVGIGVTPSAWSAVVPAIQLGPAGSFIAGQGSNRWVGIGNNAHYNGSSWVYKTSSVSGAYFINGNVHEWQIAGSGTAGNTFSYTQAMTLDASGNLGIGVTPSAWGSDEKAIDIGGANQSSISGLQTTSFAKNCYFDGTNWIYKQTGVTNAQVFQLRFDGGFSWNTAAAGTAGNAITFTQAMTLDASGNLMVGVTSPEARFTVGGAIAGAANSTICRIGSIDYTTSTVLSVAPGVINFDAPGVVGGRLKITSNGELVVGGTLGWAVTGSISARGYAARSGQSGSFSGNGFNIDWTGSAQLWIDTTNLGSIQLSSDYRIKRNIATQEQLALDRITQLRPVTYQRADYGTLFQADDVVREGFIAHELAEVIPSAVDGEKDAEGQIQSLKLDALCSVMVKAIQELKAELDTVKAELATLKG